jgi:hypothetical protein
MNGNNSTICKENSEINRNFVKMTNNHPLSNIKKYQIIEKLKNPTKNKKNYKKLNNIKEH